MGGFALKFVAIALLMVLFIDGFLFLGQEAMNDLHPGGTSLYDYDSSLLKDADMGNYTLNTTYNPELPESAQGVTEDSGNIFTDIFSSIKGWIGEKSGFNYVYKIVNAVPSFVMRLGLPDAFAFAIGAIWHLFTLFMIILLIWGRD